MSVHACFLIALRSVKDLPGVPSRDQDSNSRTRACRTASRRTTELRRTQTFLLIASRLLGAYGRRFLTTIPASPRPLCIPLSP
jgi:hypothetical protein